ncbi:transposase [Shewanella sp. 6_MG-2023]|uniref:transposase n=1 Tax=Shewanella sp. 6_MG-2023 TaxID=3062660 RepID=UPI0026E182A2|nr:transposase [Shewanella sp. 6_MG-2023]MDO6620149.1 transposase [Shewanella sp. 6_MG-2023]
MTRQQIFKTNMVITRSNREYKITMMNDDLVTLQVLKSDNYQIVPVDQLLAEYQLGTLTLPVFNSNVDHAWLTQKQCDQIKRYDTYLNYLDKQLFHAAKDSLKLTIATCGEVLNEPLNYRPSASTLQRWYKKWRVNNRNSIYLLKSNKHDPSLHQSNRIPTQMRQLVNDIIDSEYLTLNGPNIAQCYKILTYRHHQMDLDCKMMSKSTFYREINKLDKNIVVKKREGVIAANKNRRNAKQKYQANGLFERCEMDAVHVNIYLVNEHGEIIGKPIIFLIIDVYSRCILGMHISIQGAETTYAAVSVLRHAILPKAAENYTYLTNKWGCHGTPINLYVDSGTSFINDSMNSLLAQLKITRIAGPSRQPWKRPFIERFNSTLRNKLKGIPGYLGKKSDGKTFDKAGKHYATLTLSEFEKIVCILINDEYHQEPHGGLNNQSPSEVWAKNIAFCPAIVPPNVSIFDMYLRHQALGKIQQTKGVQYKKQFFNSDELRQLYCSLQIKNLHKDKVIFYVDELDASDIVVINPLNNSPLFVQNTCVSSHMKTFEQLKATESVSRPNIANAKIKEISKAAQLRKKQASKDKVLTKNIINNETISLDQALDPSIIEKMFTKRQTAAFSELTSSTEENNNNKEVQQKRPPKIITYKTRD